VSIDVLEQRMWRGVTPCQTIAETELFELVAFGEESSRATYPIVIVYSNVNRAYILDFARQLSVIQQFVRAGLAVYVLDWKIPHSSEFGLKEYANQALVEALESIRRRKASAGVHLFGYCWGGVFAAIYAALHPANVVSLTFLATPIDFANASPSTIELWARRPTFDPKMLTGRDGLVPGKVIKRILLGSSPVQAGVGKLYELLECGRDPQLVQLFFEGQHWLHDTPPVAGQVFAEMVRKLYQENQLVRGSLRVDGRIVALGAIKCPVFIIVGERDHLVSPKGSLKVVELVSTPPEQINCFKVATGHVGLTCGIKAHTDVWPLVARSLVSMNGQRCG
jgi:polyhydroxyalkanoate synthase